MTNGSGPPSHKVNQSLPHFTELTSLKKFLHHSAYSTDFYMLHFIYFSAEALALLTTPSSEPCPPASLLAFEALSSPAPPRLPLSVRLLDHQVSIRSLFVLGSFSLVSFPDISTQL